jgi:transposase-like protein
VSIASVALAQGLNADLLRRWSIQRCAGIAGGAPKPMPLVRNGRDHILSITDSRATAVPYRCIEAARDPRTLSSYFSHQPGAEDGNRQWNHP